MVLVEININGTVHKISTEMVSLETPYLPKILSIFSPKYSAPGKHGGFVQMSYGKIVFWPDLFEDDWPPPDQCGIEVYYTSTTESAKVFVLSGNIMLSNIYQDKIEYNVFDDISSILALDLALGYGTTAIEVPLWRAFSYASYQPPLRLPDTHGAKFTYHGHDLYNVGAALGWNIYDDGVNVNANALSDDGWVTFYLTVNPVGEITLTGSTAAGNSNLKFLQWCDDRLGLSSTTFIYDISFPYYKVITSQMSVVELLDDFCKQTGTLAFVKNDRLYAYDMDRINGSVKTLTEFNHFSNNIIKNPPLDEAINKWTIRKPTTNPQEVTETESTLIVKSLLGFSKNSETIEFNWSSRYVIESVLSKIIDYTGRPTVSVKMPLGFDLPDLCEQYQWTTDESFIQPLKIALNAREIVYDLMADEVNVKGDSYISYIGDSIWFVPAVSTVTGEVVPLLQFNPENGAIRYYWLRNGQGNLGAGYYGGCTDENNVLHFAPYGADYSCLFDPDNGNTRYSYGFSDTITDNFINVEDAPGTSYCYSIPYGCDVIVRRTKITSYSYPFAHGKTVVGGAYIGSCFANSLIWMIGHAYAGITAVTPSTGAMADYSHANGTFAYSGCITMGGNIWAVPKKVNGPISEFSSTTGLIINEYANTAIADLYGGVVSDGTDLWLLPGSGGSSIYRFNMTTHVIDITYPTSGYSNGDFIGGCYYDGYVYLSPAYADDIVRVTLSDGTITAYPHGVTSTTCFRGALVTT